MSKLVKIESEQILTTTIVIEDEELRYEVLGFLLGSEKADLDKIIETSEQFAFTGGMFRTIIPSYASHLSTDAHEIIYDIANHPTYWATDRFVYQVQMETPSKEQANDSN